VAQPITAEDIQRVAEKAFFLFEIDLRDGNDVFIIPGDGTDDLDRVISLMQRNYLVRARLDVLPTPIDPQLKEVVVTDVQQLRETFWFSSPAQMSEL
jgi:hypothetical protein